MLSFGLTSVSPSANRSRKVSESVPVFSPQSSCPQSPQTPRALISQLSSEFSPHRYRYEHGHVVSLDEDPDSDSKSVLNVEFSSPLGLQLHSLMEKQAPRFPQYSLSVVDGYCHTPKKSDMILKLRHQGQCVYPVTFRKSKKAAAAYCHFYKFTRVQAREWWITIHTGMDRRTRRLRARLPPCRIRLHCMTDDEIEAAKQKAKADHLKVLRERCKQPLYRSAAHQPVYPLYITQNPMFFNMFNGNMVNTSMRQQGSCLALTPPTTPERVSPTQGVNDKDPIVIDEEEDEIVCMSGPVRPAPARSTPRPPVQPRGQESLLFKCHLCDAELSCRDDFGRCVEGHYANAHGLSHIRLVRHQDASGQMVVSIVEKEPQVSNGFPRTPQPASPRARNTPRTSSASILRRSNVSSRTAAPKAAQPDVICID